jgi:hypothetical protein
VETDSTGAANDQEEANQEDNTGDSVVANTILASNDTGDEEAEQTNVLPVESEDNFSRMAIIRRAQEATGVSEDTIKFLEDAQRASTRKTYDNG